MDVQSSFGLLINWFKKSDTFIFSKHFRQLDWDLIKEENETLNDEDAKTCLEIALNDMGENGMVKVSEKGTGKQKEKIYVIVESMKNSPVEIYISRQTANNLITVSKGLLPLIDLEAQIDERQDPDEGHIILLLQAVSVLSEKLQEQMELNNKSKNPPPPEQ